MKKILTLLLSLMLCMSFVAVLASCDHEHTVSAEWAKDATNHWHTCADCEEQLDKAEHTFGESTKVKNGVYTYACTACGEIKTETAETKITAEQLTNLTLGENFIVTVEATHKTMGTMLWVEMRDGNKFSTEETMTDPSGAKDTYRDFHLIEGEELYRYQVEYNDQDVVVSCERAKSDLTAAEYIESENKEFVPNKIRDLSLYTYDEETNTYVAPVINNLSNVKIAFENSKIVSLSYTESMNDGSTATYAITFIYGTASVTIPDLIPAQ